MQLGQHVVLSLPRGSGCDVIASLPSAPRIEFEFFDPGAGQAKETFAHFEAAEFSAELASGRGERLTEMIKGHGSVAGDLSRGIGREERLSHGLQATFEEVVEADVSAEEREDIIVERTGRLAGDDEGETRFDRGAQENDEARERRGLMRDIDDEIAAHGAVGRVLGEFVIKRAQEQFGHGVAASSVAAQRGDDGRF